MSLIPSKVLYIDLTSYRIWTEDREELFRKYIGGIGVGIKILEEELKQKADPLSPDNVIVISTGPLAGLFPVISKAVMTFKSPLTNALGESHAGGRLGVAMAWAGYGAIVIKGASERPVYLSIHDNNVKIKDARAIWGLSTHATGRVLREIEPGRGVRSISRIGPAGERIVKYSCVNVDSFRHFGRLGAGAVWGSKKLKAIVISGTYRGKIPKEIRGEYFKLFKEIYEEIVGTEAMKKYHDLGTPANILPLNAIGGLPTRNLKENKYELADKISGEEFARRVLVKKLACLSCPIGCIHVGLLREEFPGYDYETLLVSYDYELIYALGSLLGLKSCEEVLRLIEIVEREGLDAMYTGVALSWTTEAMEKGLIPNEDALGIRLEWGNVDNYIKAAEHIARKRGKLYSLLAEGLHEATKVYGGKEFALEFGKNGMPGYHNGPATHIGYLIGARHSHLDNAGYSFDQKCLKKGTNPSPEEIVDELMKEEQWRCVTNSLVMCLFARKVYTPERVLRALRIVGYDIKDEEELLKIGKEIYKKRWEFNVREGVKRKDLLPPERIFETPSARGKINREEFMKALNYFFEKMKIPERREARKGSISCFFPSFYI